MKKSAKIVAGTALALLIANGSMVPSQATYAVYGPMPQDRQTVTSRPSSSSFTSNESRYFGKMELNYYGYGDSGRMLFQVLLTDIQKHFSLTDVQVSWTDNLIKFDESKLSVNNTMYYLERESDGTVKVNIILPKRSFPRDGKETISFKAGKETITVHFEPQNNNGYWYNSGTPYFDVTE